MITVRTHSKDGLIDITVQVEKGRPLLGRWQAVMLAEFDWPRERTVHMKVIKA